MTGNDFVKASRGEFSKTHQINYSTVLPRLATNGPRLLLQPYNATKTKKTLGDRAFQVASPGLWNGLPNDIRNAKTMDVFKSLVKTYLFRKAYACYF